MLTLEKTDLPPRLASVASPPERLYIEGRSLDDILQSPAVAIVGSRKLTPYGRDVTRRFATKLAEQGIIIISGLAFGVDSIAHQATLDAGGVTIAVLPSPLESIYPSSHRQLARRIVEQGGALVTEYPAGTKSFRGNFVARNRLIAGLSDAVLIPEAALKSGSLHTARFALNAGRDVLAVPGNITSPTSEGTNNLIKTGAITVTDYEDVLLALGMSPVGNKTVAAGNDAERSILEALRRGMREGDELQAASGLSVELYNQTLTMMEITGKIRSLGANQWSL